MSRALLDARRDRLVTRLWERRPDEPNVQESKDKTKSLLDHLTREGNLPIWLALSRPGTYVSILAYLHRSPAVDTAIFNLRKRVGTVLPVPILFGYGPRYLHSIGQLYKGGPPRGMFIVLTADASPDVSIPDSSYTFGQLQTAQALGDVEALREHGRPTLRIHLKGNLATALDELERAVDAALAR